MSIYLKTGIIPTMLNKITQQIHTRLINQKKTISVAESCTGGELSSLLTSLPGSSAYFILGVVTYSNKSKEMILNIPAKKIARHGAVSRQIAILMAKNIRKKTLSDFGISITGIAGPVRGRTPKVFDGCLRQPASNGAGPTGTTTTKSIGTVYICLSGKNKNICRKFNFSGNREKIREKSTQEALRLLKKRLETKGRFS